MGSAPEAEMLNTMILNLRELIRQCRFEDAARPEGITNLATLTFTRFQRLGSAGDLEEAIACYRQATTLRHPNHRNYAPTLDYFATTLVTRFRIQGRVEDLEEAIGYHHRLLNIRPPDHPKHSTSLNNLAAAIFARYEQLGRVEDLEEAIKNFHQALDLCPPGHPDRSTSLNNLASSLWGHFVRYGNMEELEEAITYHEESLTLRPPDHPNRCETLDNLGSTLSTRFGIRGNVEDLERAVAYCRESLELCPPGHHHRATILGNLGITLFKSFERQGKTEDLEDVIKYHREALTLRPPGHPQRSIPLNNLATAIFTRFQLSGEMEDLELTIKYCKDVLALHPSDLDMKCSCLGNLASALSAHFIQLGDIKDLELAIVYFREALSICPPGHSKRSNALNNLAFGVSIRFDQLGKIEDLEEQITCYTQALTLHPPGHPHHSVSLNNLASSLTIRFKQFDRIEDLDEAITYHNEALALHGPGHINRSTSLNNLAATLFYRFQRLGKTEDLQNTITYLRDALDLRSLNNPDHSGSLNLLGLVYSTRFDKLGQKEDLEEAITYHRKALALRPPGHPHRFSSLHNIGSAFSTRFEKLGRREDLEEAINHFSDARENLPAEHPTHTTLSHLLASAYLMKHGCDPQSGDYLTMAFSLYESAANHSTARSIARLEAALEWARAAQRFQHESTIRAFSTSFTLLDRCLIANPTVESQQKFLATSKVVPKSLASDAAASAIAEGKLETAVELLEQGRAILWSKMQGYRHPLEELRQVNKELADQFETISGQLERHAMSSESDLVASRIRSDGVGSTLQVPFDVRMRTFRVLSEEWNEVIKRIRKIDGFADFLQAVPFSTLKTAALDGPVIIVNISKYRADAIIVRGMGPLVLVPLPEASPEDLVLLSSQLSKYRAVGPWQRIFMVLRSLWDIIVYPVKQQLTALGVAEQSRIWWCPTSELCALPLHAAGIYAPGTTTNLPDTFISSYTPTLSALIRARSGLVSESVVPRLFVVGLLHKSLPKVEEEIHGIQQLVDSIDVLIGEPANPNAVLGGLQQHRWAHFACHGHLSPQPFHSSFELHGDQRLTLIEIIKARIPNAELAFLSACHSAAGDTRDSPNEVIHLAAALQFCGFRSVVGTLWRMADVDGPGVAEEFYKYMFRESGSVDFRDSAEALNLTTRAMRRKRGMTVDRWINFVHIGA